MVISQKAIDVVSDTVVELFGQIMELGTMAKRLI